MRHTQTVRVDRRGERSVKPSQRIDFFLTRHATQQQRELPPGLTPRDKKILRSVNRRAHYLDKGFRILGMRFGWTFLIGTCSHFPIYALFSHSRCRHHSRSRRCRRHLPELLPRRPQGQASRVRTTLHSHGFLLTHIFSVYPNIYTTKCLPTTSSPRRSASSRSSATSCSPSTRPTRATLRSSRPSSASALPKSRRR